MKNSNKYAWQEEAIEKLISHKKAGNSDFLIYAGVGSGKTRAALTAAIRTRAKRIIVYTYTAPLVLQWSKAAKELGIDLIAMDGNAELANKLPSDVQGFATTFDSMGAWPDVHEIKCTEVDNTFVIIDEDHHLSEETGEWGKASDCLANASFRLHLTGTPLRTDKTKIPFLEYKKDGELWELVTDGPGAYAYSYGEAVANGTCSRVGFSPFDGEIKWRKGGTDYNHSLTDDIHASQVSARKNAAISIPDSGSCENHLVMKLLARADRMLGDIRTEQSDAAGVIACKDINHAYDIARELERICGEKPIVVTNIDKEARGKITAFRHGISRWIVSVQMVTEGVDIPRLRVAAYLSNVETELFWWQFMGRIVRSGKPAHFFFPGTQQMQEWAAKVEEEVEIAFKEKEKGGGGGGGGGPLEYENLGADGDLTGSIIAGNHFDKDLAAFAHSQMNKHGLSTDDIFGVMSLISEVRKEQDPYWNQFIAKEPNVPVETYSEKQKRLRETLHRKVGRYCRLGDFEHGEVNKRINKAVGIFKRSEATIEQLERQINIITEDITRIQNGH